MLSFFSIILLSKHPFLSKFLLQIINIVIVSNFWEGIITEQQRVCSYCGCNLPANDNVYCHNCGANLSLKDDEFIAPAVSIKTEARTVNESLENIKPSPKIKSKGWISPSSYRTVVSAICFFCVAVGFIWNPGIFIGLVISIGLLLLTVYIEKSTKGNHLYSLLICICAIVIIIVKLIWFLAEYFD